MASVAICPHCYLQLVVPDGIEADERVECPTCAKEFGLDEAVLRAIPEVVRRPLATAPIGAIQETAEFDAVVADLVEIDEIVVETDDDREAVVIEEIKARIEAEIAANGLNPGTKSTLSLEPLADDDQSLSIVEQAGNDLAASFRHAKTVPELPPLGELAEFADDAMSQAADEAAVVDEPTVVEDVSRIVEIAGSVDEPAEFVPEPLETRLTRPTVRTLADLLPPREGIEAASGPSFDLPNVPLSPSNGATIEIDPNMSFGPAAETEFELDDVDFESMPADELVAEADYESIEPVFSDPEAAAVSAAPFVLPALPRARKKRSAVRMLVGTTLGGVVGLSIGYFVLLYLLGPEGDFLNVAQYIPSAVLPTSFHPAAAQVAVAEPESTDEAATVPTGDEESSAVPAGYAEEAETPAEATVLDEPESDDRYGTEPLPLDEPAAEPIAADSSSTAIPPQPLRGPTFTVAQLAAALEAGKAAEAGLVTGDLSNASVRRTKGMSFAKLCDLAEALTFVDRSSPSVESEQAIEGTDRLFRGMFADAHTRVEVARIAQIWIDSPHRGHGGVFLAGTVGGGQIAGDVYEYELADGNGSKLTLLMREPLDPLVEGSDRPVGIVGSIVDNPAERVAGYRGTANRAIWVARAIPLD